MRGVLPNNGNNSVETINAAARAIVSAERRVQQPTVQKRRWVGCLSVYWCFGSHRHGSRIGHAVILPDPTSSENGASTGNGVPAGGGQGHVPMPSLPFIAPPSSPASFLQSEPPTATQSPGGVLSLCSLSSNVYSPVGHSIFAIGPYAHETQLVSPPVFSTFTTEPSTAPFTPPPESVHVTTPSSPEVPFAKLVSSALDAKRKNENKALTFPLPFAPVQYSEFQAYQLYPGSPIGHLISPSSAISGSGTSSPFPDNEFSSNSFPASASALLSQVYDPPNMCSANAHTKAGKSAGQQHLNSSFSELRAHILPNSKANDCSQGGSLFMKRGPQLVSSGDVAGGSIDELVDHRVSFALCSPEVSCKAADRGDGEGYMPESPVLMAVSKRLSGESNASKLDLWLEKPIGRLDDRCSAAESSGMGSDGVAASDRSAGNASVGSSHLVESVDLSVSKEFKFDNADGAMGPATITSSEWWTNEKVGAKAGSKNWAFFPMIHPGFS
ncbi:unnamed protein product [Victoria cruziana]